MYYLASENSYINNNKDYLEATSLSLPYLNE